MSQTLYRKYRPQEFKDLVGQDHIKVTLENEIRHHRISHAYLFTGPRGVGKTTTARLLAKAINCETRKDAEPCNTCDSCREIMAGRSLDMIEIDAASHTQVDHVRENIIPNARTVPTKNKYKVFIIDEVHMLSLSAFNALLKILEEPPAFVIFILATTEVHKLPETIISRCQRFDFKRVRVSEIKNCLKKIAKEEKIEIEDKILQTISITSDGSIRDAEGLLGQVFSLGEKRITQEMAELVLPRSDFKLIFGLWHKLINRQAKEAIELINQLVAEGMDLKYFCQEFIDFLRKAMLTKIEKNLGFFSLFEIDKNDADEFIRDLEKITESELKKMIEELIRRRREIDYSFIPQLALELAVVELCQAANNHDSFIPVQDSVENRIRKPQGGEKKGEEKIQLEEIKKKWPQIVSRLNQDNHSLALVLKNCLPVSINEGELTIGCHFKFHQERLSDHKNLEKVEKIIIGILKKKIRLKFIVEQIKTDWLKKETAGTEKNNFDEVLATFEGEILEK